MVPLMKSLNFQMKLNLFRTALLFTLTLLSLVANFPYEFNFNVNVIKSEEPELKTILLWTSKFHDKTFGLRYK